MKINSINRLNVAYGSFIISALSILGIVVFLHFQLPITEEKYEWPYGWEVAKQQFIFWGINLIHFFLIFLASGLYILEKIILNYFKIKNPKVYAILTRSKEQNESVK